MFSKHTSQSVIAWAIIKPNQSIKLDSLHESLKEATHSMGENIVGWSNWKDLSAEKRQIYIKAAELEGWKVIPVVISPAS